MHDTYVIKNQLLILGFTFIIVREKGDILQGNLRALTSSLSGSVRFTCRRGHIRCRCGFLCSGRSVAMGDGESRGSKLVHFGICW